MQPKPHRHRLRTEVGRLGAQRKGRAGQRVFDDQVSMERPAAAVRTTDGDRCATERPRIVRAGTLDGPGPKARVAVASMLLPWRSWQLILLPAEAKLSVADAIRPRKQDRDAVARGALAKGRLVRGLGQHVPGPAGRGDAKRHAGESK